MKPDQDQPWTLDTTQWLLTAPTGDKITLTYSEVDMLHRLLSRPGELIMREELDDPTKMRSESIKPRTRLDVKISRLRRRATSELGQLPLRTAYGRGYVWTAPAAVIGVQAA